MSNEKRRFSRVYFDANAKLTVGDDDFSVSRIANLSVGGCLLELTADHDVGQECLFSIPLSHMGPGVEIFSEIVRRKDGFTSLQFKGISPESLLHLQNIIRYNSDDPERIEDEISTHPGLK